MEKRDEETAGDGQGGQEGQRDTYRGIEEDRLEGNEGGWMRRWEMDKEGIGIVEVEKVNLGDIGS